MHWWQCPRCGGRLRFVSGRVWCPRPRCSFDKALPKPTTEAVDDGGF